MSELVWTSEGGVDPADESLCTRCHKSVMRMCGGRPEEDNELRLAVKGGYGSFTDTVIDVIGDPDPDNVYHGVTKSGHRIYEMPYKHHKGMTEHGTCRQCAFQALDVLLCHECGHELMDWLGVSRETVSDWHSHATEYVEKNPDHWGWDYKHRAENP